MRSALKWNCGFSDLFDLPSAVVQPRRKSSAWEDGEKGAQAACESVEKWTLGCPNPFLTLNGLVIIRISRLNVSASFPGSRHRQSHRFRLSDRLLIKYRETWAHGLDHLEKAALNCDGDFMRTMYDKFRFTLFAGNGNLIMHRGNLSAAHL